VSTTVSVNTRSSRCNGATLRVPLTTIKSVVLTSALFWTLLLVLPTAAQAAGPSSLDDAQLGDTFSVLLQGTYRSVVHGPNLGLTQVNLSDGTYSTTKIFPISGLPNRGKEHANRGNRDHDSEAEDAIGRFFVQIGTGNLVAYDLPGGALAMAFTGNNVQRVPDGEGGTYIVGTFDLDIIEATGIFRPFAGGRNRMVDILHRLADGTFVEHCICIIRRPGVAG
jgi:hypothetical protein